MAERSYLERLHLELIERGQVIEAGWISLRLAAIPLNAPALQIAEMHKAYMAGAQHMWATVFAAMDGDSEPTADDMRRLDLIAAEMKVYGDKLMADLPTQGRA